MVSNDLEKLNHMPGTNTIIYLCGIYTLVFAILHIFFWKIFNWKNDLTRLSVINRGVMQILNVCLIYFFLFTAFICFFHTDELFKTSLGRSFLAGISLFWLLRTIQQFIFLKINNRIVHLLTILFFIGAILFALPVFL